jgi:hypothetical protein
VSWHSAGSISRRSEPGRTATGNLWFEEAVML